MLEKVEAMAEKEYFEIQNFPNGYVFKQKNVKHIMDATYNNDL